MHLGVGVKGRCEAIIHAVSHLFSTRSDPDDHHWTLLLDFSNAFNCTNREMMFKETHIPAIAAWMKSCYSCQPLLFIGEHTIHSCCGMQQGDPLRGGSRDFKRGCCFLLFFKLLPFPGCYLPFHFHK